MFWLFQDRSKNMVASCSKKSHNTFIGLEYLSSYFLFFIFGNEYFLSSFLQLIFTSAFSIWSNATSEIFILEKYKVLLKYEPQWRQHSVQRQTTSTYMQSLIIFAKLDWQRCIFYKVAKSKFAFF